MGGDKDFINGLGDLFVSIHAPAWGATETVDSQFLQPSGFNPRPRMGGDFAFDDVAQTLDVSIHAPAWGATNNNESAITGCLVSIHAPAWGATSTDISTGFL